MNRGRRVRVGDVFQMPVAPGQIGFGQVVANVKPNPPLLGIFEPLFPADGHFELDEVVGLPLLFLVNSFDVKIKNSEWPVVGSRPPRQVELPNFRLGSGDESLVISYDAKSRRRATPDELAKLDYRNSVSPALLLRALRAHHGYEPWEDDFERYRYDRVHESAKIKI